ncbi:MAG: hypothetical protein Q4C49_04865 [Bacillota bacterium]|nr:hypothetical protein [Bacillota bacterium]
MKADSNTYRHIANQIQSRINFGYVFEDPMKRYRHNAIQNKLSQLSSYFSQSANSIENNEYSLLSITPNSITSTKEGAFQDGHFSTNFNSLINWDSIFNKGNRKSSVTAGFQYAYKEATFFGVNDTYIRSRMNVNLGDVQASGMTKFSLWKDKIFHPDFTIVANMNAAVVAANSYVRLGTNNIFAQVSAKGSVGSVYANATAVLNMEEQTLDLGIGAAAARGEVRCSFTIFGYSVTLTGEGSIGSAEANISYSHKNREWEFGSKLGFIAGLGFKVHVNY